MQKLHHLLFVEARAEMKSVIFVLFFHIMYKKVIRYHVFENDFLQTNICKEYEEF